jgi:hypothetical protein
LRRVLFDMNGNIGQNLRFAEYPCVFYHSAPALGQRRLYHREAASHELDLFEAGDQTEQMEL